MFDYQGFPEPLGIRLDVLVDPSLGSGRERTKKKAGAFVAD
jgi:hypothetical protein